LTEWPWQERRLLDEVPPAEVCLRRIGLSLAVIIFVTLPPLAQGNNPPVPPDAKHASVKLEKGQKRQAVPA